MELGVELPLERLEQTRSQRVRAQEVDCVAGLVVCFGNAAGVYGSLDAVVSRQ